MNNQRMLYCKDPAVVGNFSARCKEMMFYQYLPIKMAGASEVTYEGRLKCFDMLIVECISDFAWRFGAPEFIDSYIYLTAKCMYQAPGSSFNRPGYHSDGFMTNDINYIWSDRFPTVFNRSEFMLSQDDELSVKEMQEQANPKNDFTFPDETLIRLDQYSIHKVGESTGGMRTFFKLSFSKDKYNLEGNSHNYLLDYKWDMFKRKETRNIPQKIK